MLDVMLLVKHEDISMDKTIQLLEVANRMGLEINDKINRIIQRKEIRR